jgi:hypothetical protein
MKSIESDTRHCIEACLRCYEICFGAAMAHDTHTKAVYGRIIQASGPLRYQFVDGLDVRNDRLCAPDSPRDKLHF